MRIARKALVIGIDFYENINNLYGCVNDACNVKKVLERNSDETLNFDLLCFTSTDKNTMITRNFVKSKVKELFADDMEVVLFYFAGHGYIDEIGGYLVTSECKTGEDGFALSELMAVVNNSPAKNKIIILDSCYSGVIGKDSVSEAFTRISEGVTILTACSETQYAAEENGSGVFTNLLVDALHGSAANILGEVTPGSIYAHIDQSLGAWKQRPVFKTNVKAFVSLRKVDPSISLDNLKAIIILFEDCYEEFQLDPTFEPTSNVADEENCKKFAILQKLNRINLVIPVEAEHMYFAAIEGKRCKLTSIGIHYWKLVKNGQI